jgi:hypothetical protein
VRAWKEQGKLKIKVNKIGEFMCPFFYVCVEIKKVRGSVSNDKGFVKVKLLGAVAEGAASIL